MEQPLTLVYKSTGDVPLNLDVYLPKSSFDPASRSISAVIYFHGGGLTVGNRRSWFPEWLQTRCNAAGHAFISADYRLIPSGLSNAHGILEDVKDVFSFICSSEFELALAKTRGEEGTIRIDPKRIAVAGTSSGGTCAYLAAKHAEPKPRALLSIYAAGGDFFTRHWLSPKTTVFFRGRELLDPNAYSKWIYPFSPEEKSLVVTDSPNTYFPADHPTPGLPSNPRSKLSALYLQLGTYLDYYTGQHEPSLSATVRGFMQDNLFNISPSKAATAIAGLIPDEHRLLFPQLIADSSWPPTLFYHGAPDSAVPVNESKNMYELLRNAGVSADIIVVDGKEHSFDYAPDAKETQKENFDRMADFLNRHLSP